MLSSLLLTAFSLAVFTTPAFSQSPFPVPGPASLPLDEGRDELVRSCNMCHPIMAMLGQRFPQAQFLITGVLGPHSNAHGPNEFLHIPYAKKLTACVAEVLAAHATRDG
jgi:hypothetical protein